MRRSAQSAKFLDSPSIHPSRGGIMHKSLVILMVACLAGCSTYQAVDRPWNRDWQAEGKMASRKVHVGDKVRITRKDDTVIYGTATEVSADMIVFTTGRGGRGFTILQADEVQSLDVMISADGPSFEKILAVGIATVIISAGIDVASDGSFNFR